MQFLHIDLSNMKRLLPSLVFLALANSAIAQAQDFSISEIEPLVNKTPKYNFSLATQKRTPNAQKWLEVDVKFEAQPAFTDELTFRYYILFAGKLLVGEVTHVNIPAGNELYSVMYLTPNTINRLLGGKSFTSGAIENIAVQILNEGQLVAQKSWKPARDPLWFQKMKQVQGMIVDKNKTPFAPLYWDRYMEIKPGQ